MCGRQKRRRAHSRNAVAATAVGTSAPTKRPAALTAPSWKLPLRIDRPAGLGAFAITVNPPPVIAPLTSAYLYPSSMPSTSEPRYVSAALSVMAVSAVAAH